MSTLPQQQASVMLNRQENMAPPAQAYRHAPTWHAHFIVIEKQDNTCYMLGLYHLHTQAHPLCVKQDLIPTLPPLIICILYHIYT